jgi:flagellar biosynthesis anti-sigma factor FlgM
LDRASPGSDAVRFSAEHSTVLELVAQIVKLPEIRAEKVAALQQAIGGGQYAVTAEHTTDAILSAIEERTAA